MIPYICQVSTNPETGTSGDCMRACIASILEMEPIQVPHFYPTGVDGPAGFAHMREWLEAHDYFPFMLAFPPELSLEQALDCMRLNKAHYILIGGTRYEDNHAVVCCGNKVVHNPAWVKTPIIQPASADGIMQWQILIIGRK